MDPLRGGRVPQAVRVDPLRGGAPALRVDPLKGAAPGTKGGPAEGGEGAPGTKGLTRKKSSLLK